VRASMIDLNRATGDVTAAVQRMVGVARDETKKRTRAECEVGNCEIGATDGASTQIANGWSAVARTVELLRN